MWEAQVEKGGIMVQEEVEVVAEVVSCSRRRRLPTMALWLPMGGVAAQVERIFRTLCRRAEKTPFFPMQGQSEGRGTMSPVPLALVSNVMAGAEAMVAPVMGEVDKLQRMTSPTVEEVVVVPGPLFLSLKTTSSLEIVLPIVSSSHRV